MKNQITSSKLQPALLDKLLHVGRPNLGDRNALIARINGMLDRRWFSNNGPLVQEFENKIADFIGVKHAVAMCNATVALEIASRALKLHGEVIVPSYTFVATAHALQWQEITPVFCDMDPATHNIDPAKIEQLITPKTTGILGVHVWGRGCDTEIIEEIAARRNLKVMYDASHGFACSRGGRMLGTFGECEVFSFHATKFLNCFEGGAVEVGDGHVVAVEARGVEPRDVGPAAPHRLLQQRTCLQTLDLGGVVGRTATVKYASGACAWA